MHIVKHGILVKTEPFIRLLAGSIVLLGVALALMVSSWWLLLTASVGVNLIQSAFTGFCPPTLVLRHLGWVDDSDVIHWGGHKRTTRKNRAT